MASMAHISNQVRYLAETKGLHELTYDFKPGYKVVLTKTTQKVKIVNSKGDVVIRPVPCIGIYLYSNTGQLEDKDIVAVPYYETAYDVLERFNELV